ncbi:aldehyde dehydrogenase [Virgisporangium aliadipatigenens]|uniref:aldehyde dehydrogenase (NAD(+)) n=1 Tax=Virgisporangium aliadipatigenens TaxID=741659 RepID=A0A8J3YN24_9ACTN|nr:aldehyde dehydrogenase family protein [Virgisporangium aliadipatigenens]GIJ46890.1 aldehyde dehydrogenase [Virgisporangium aliadipatigenens]
MDISAPGSRQRLYINGQWIEPAGTEKVPVENPSTEEVFASVPSGTAADVDRAVAAARAAFGPWADLAPKERAAHLERLLAALSARAGDIAGTVSQELGTPLKISQRVQAGLPLAVLKSYVALAAEEDAGETIGNSLVVREPVGVVGAITPWNYPLHQIVAKVAPALAAGNTVVVKPAELTPLVAYLLFDAIDEAGLPPGVVNLVPGSGRVVGAAIAAHPDVDMISFTGSTRVGAQISHLAADRIARVSLELGGKSANVILEDADLVRAVKGGVANAFLNAGQTCTAWTRMLVHRSVYEDALSLAAEAADKHTLGDPFDEHTRMGPLSCATQRKTVREYIEKGLAEGARLVTGGLDARTPERGHFVAPTVLADVDPDSTVAQEEIFGPVLSVIPFDSDEHAVEIANNSKYGLAGGVWAGSEERAMAVARRMRTGAVDVNGGAFNPLAPFGGYKQSGIGRELGVHGLHEFQQVKAIQR